MNLLQIYEKYQTPKNLREHMLRVASLCKIITDNWQGSEVNELSMIKACALHDITKPITFDLDKQKSYGTSQEEIAKLAELQILIRNNYGDDEHQSTINLCKDIGMGEIAVKILGNIEWKYIPNLIESNDLESLISVYCDMRIGPNGILPLQERIENLKERNPGKYNIESFMELAKIIEPKIQENVRIDLNSITERQLEPLFPGLLNLEI